MKKENRKEVKKMDKTLKRVADQLKHAGYKVVYTGDGVVGIPPKKKNTRSKKNNRKEVKKSE